LEPQQYDTVTPRQARHLRVSLGKRWICLSLLMMTVLLAACGNSQPTLTPLPPDAVILAFGDSLTFGTGASAATSYPTTLGHLTGQNVIRAGVPGEVTAEGLQRLPKLLEKHRPQLVILCHGGNDMIRKLDKHGLRANLRKMIETARSHGAEVLLVGVPAPGLFLSTAVDYREIANELGVPLEDAALAEILSDRSLKSDAAHPNAAGYQRLAEAIAKVLSQAGAI
jgi:lysophospholipase L1-like esterase